VTDQFVLPGLEHTARTTFTDIETGSIAHYRTLQARASLAAKRATASQERCAKPDKDVLKQ